MHVIEEKGKDILAGDCIRGELYALEDFTCSNSKTRYLLKIEGIHTYGVNSGRFYNQITGTTTPLFFTVSSPEEFIHKYGGADNLEWFVDIESADIVCLLNTTHLNVLETVDELKVKYKEV